MLGAAPPALKPHHSTGRLRLLGVLPLIIWSARRLGLGAAWALLTTAGLTVLTVTPMLSFSLGDRLPLVVIAAVALPAGSAWATWPDRAWWVRLVRIMIIATGVAVAVASYQATD